MKSIDRYIKLNRMKNKKLRIKINMYVQVISEFNIGHKKNRIHYPVEQFLGSIEKQSKNNCFFSKDLI